MYPDKPMDDFEAISYNKLSHFINILNVDFSQPVTIFEGYFDSHFFPNSIGVIGVNTDITFLLKDESLNLRFFYDNDSDGYKASNEKLKMGYKVFLWKLLFKDIVKRFFRYLIPFNFCRLLFGNNIANGCVGFFKGIS